mgnify:FL=1
MIDNVSALILILAMAVTTFATRAASFLLFPKDKEVPPKVVYLGRVLPPAIIGMLVVYCLKSTQVVAYPYGIPELIACVVVIALHLWKRNSLLSIGVGTAVYMLLVQVVFP